MLYTDEKTRVQSDSLKHYFEEEAKEFTARLFSLFSGLLQLSGVSSNQFSLFEQNKKGERLRSPSSTITQPTLSIVIPRFSIRR